MNVNEIPFRMINEIRATYGLDPIDNPAAEAHPEDVSNLYNTVDDREKRGLMSEITEAHACDSTRQVHVYFE